MRTLLIFLVLLGSISAQTPEPSVEPSLEPATTAESPADLAPGVTPAPTADRVSGDADFTDEIATLQQLRTANEQLLRKQQAALELLDELQKDADQLRIFSKRG